MKRFIAIVIAVSALMVGSGVRIVAHEGHDHKIMGTVTMAAADHACSRTRTAKTSRCR
jgi:hypothetical protein